MTFERVVIGLIVLLILLLPMAYHAGRVDEAREWWGRVERGEYVRPPSPKWQDLTLHCQDQLARALGQIERWRALAETRPR